MLIDGSTQEVADGRVVDVCVVGSGPAGLTLARELARGGFRICVLESGGMRREPAAQSLDDGEVESPHGYRAATLREGRSRQLGGTSGLWNHLWRRHSGEWIRYLPLDEIDFEQRDWVPESGWPFSRDELRTQYRSAREICGVEPIDLPAAEDAAGALQRGWETPALESGLAQFGQSGRFLRDIPEALMRDEKVELILHATLKRLCLDAGGQRVESAEVQVDGRPEFRLSARVFILAAGGLENARILLLHDGARRGGLGNDYGMVGRCFMDHPAVTLGRLRPFSAGLFERASFYDQHLINGQAIGGYLQFRPETKRRERLLNINANLSPQLRNLRTNLGPVVAQFLAKGPNFLWRRGVRRFRSGATAGSTSVQPARERLLEGYYSECFCGWSERRAPARRFSHFRVRCLVEQSPDRANRVVLGDPVDALGQRKLRIFWKWNEPELRTLRRAQQIFGAEMAAAGIGAFEPAKENATGSPFEFFSPHHFMGTTRMHVNPADGVVNADCRVHGVDNLYVAGSSVFPTSGFANPTLTVVALAVRLAERVARELEAVPTVGSVSVPI